MKNAIIEGLKNIFILGNVEGVIGGIGLTISYLVQMIYEKKSRRTDTIDTVIAGFWGLIYAYLFIAFVFISWYCYFNI